MRAFSILAGTSVLTSLIFFAACSSSSSPKATTTTNDGGTDGAIATTDGATNDGGTSGDDASNNEDAAAVNTGTLIADGMSNQIGIIGVTSDGYVVYYVYTSDTAATLSAVSITGGTPTVLTTDFGSGDAAVVGSTVLIWTGLDQDSGIGNFLGSWTHTGGLNMVNEANSIDLLASASSDGAYLIYAASAVAGSSSVAGTMDLIGYVVASSTKTTLLTGTLADDNQSDSAYCVPTLAFTGTSANAIIAACDPAAAIVDGGIDAGTTSATYTIQTFNAASAWAAARIASGTNGLFTSDTAGDGVLTGTANGTLSYTSISTSTQTTIDSNVIDALLSPDGTHAFYTFSAQPVTTTTTGGLRSSTTGSSSPTTLVAEPGFYDFYQGAHTHDSAWSKLLGFANLTQDGLGDVVLAQTGSPAAAIVLDSTTTNVVSGDAFTTDNAYALWLNAFDSTNYVGTLKAAPVAGSTHTAITIGDAVAQVLAGTASKIVYVPNASTDPDTYATTGDVVSTDLSAATPTPTVIANGADEPIYTSAAKDVVIYSVNGYTSSGIYVSPIH